MRLHFDPETHIYRLGDTIIPGVTQILQSAGLIEKRWFTEYARTRGTFVAKATHLEDLGLLDESTIDERIKGYLVAWRCFKELARFELHASEEMVHHENLGYAGTLDRRGRINGYNSILDIKTGAKCSWHQVQTAAYQIALSANPHYINGTLTIYHRRYSVYLKEDGTFRLERHKDSWDQEVWMAALTLYKWRQAYGSSGDSSAARDAGTVLGDSADPAADTASALEPPPRRRGVPVDPPLQDA